VASRLRKVLSSCVEESPPGPLEELLLPDVLLVLDVLFVFAVDWEFCAFRGAVIIGRIP